MSICIPSITGGGNNGLEGNIMERVEHPEEIINRFRIVYSHDISSVVAECEPSFWAAFRFPTGTSNEYYADFTFILQGYDIPEQCFSGEPYIVQMDYYDIDSMEPHGITYQACALDFVPIDAILSDPQIPLVLTTQPYINTNLGHLLTYYMFTAIPDPGLDSPPRAYLVHTTFLYQE